MALALMLGLALVGGARAQWGSGGMLNPVLTSINNGFVWENLSSGLEKPSAPSSAAKPRPTQSKPAQAQPAQSGSAGVQALAYSPSTAATRRNFDRFIAQTRKTDPQGADELKVLLAQPGLMDELAQELEPFGLRVGQLADAYTAYLINAWEASRGVFTPGSRRQALAVKGQLTQALLGVPEIRSASNEAKQELAEALLIQAVLIGAANEAAQQDPKLKAALSRAVRQGALGMGFDLDAFTLPDEGLKLR